MSRATSAFLRRKEPLRIGFLPVSDCAPLIYAQEAGLFAKYDSAVELRRETSWASLGDRVIYGELDGAHAPATLPFLANLSAESDPCACISGLVLSLQGNVLTISRKLWEQGVRDAQSLREQVSKCWGKRTFTFAVSLRFSTQELLLRQWLAQAGLQPDVQVRLTTIPPAQMFPTLKLGYIDGYCTGEPWASMAVQAGVGMNVATSADLLPLHPEKLFMVRQSLAAGRPDEHERVLAALLEACAFCDQPENGEFLGRMLAHSEYLDAPPECISAGLPTRTGFGTNSTEPTIFCRQHANEPTDAKAKWLIDHLHGLLHDSIFRTKAPGRTPVLKNVFRRDLFLRGVDRAAGQGAREAGRSPMAAIAGHAAA